MRRQNITYLLTMIFCLSYLQTGCRTTSKKDLRDNANYNDFNNYGYYDNNYDNNFNNTSFGNYGCYKANQDICEIEQHIFELTNEHRRKNNLSELLPNQAVSYVARDWSDSMASSWLGGIGHSGFPSQRKRVLNNITDQIDQDQIRSLSAENVASHSYGGSNQAIAETMVNMWKKSGGHNRNMKGDHTYLGVGVARRNSGGYYATQIFAK